MENPIPLPLPQRPHSGGGSRLFGRQLAATREQHRLQCEAVRSLNSLSRGRVYCDSGSYFGLPSGDPSTTQTAVLASLAERLRRCGPRPEGFSPESCLAEVAKIKDLYSQEPAHLASYRFERLRVARGKVSPQPAVSLLPPGPAQLLTDWRRTILKTDAELEFDRLQGRTQQPYWDPTLRRSKRERRRLYQALEANSMLTYCVRPDSYVGLFFVHKKDGSLRLIVDARSTNLKCKPPPRVALGTVAALAEVDLSPEELSVVCAEELGEEVLESLFAGTGGVAELPIFGSCLDVQDGFHQFDLLSMCSFFCLDDGDSASAFGVRQAWDGDRQCWVAVQPGDRVVPCIRTLSMGFSWALFSVTLQ